MLRVGVLLDSNEPSSWIADILGRLQRSEFAHLEVVAFVTPARSEPEWRQDGFDSILFRWYEGWDYHRNAGSQDALAPVQVSGLLDRTPHLTLDLAEAGARLHTFNLDLLLFLGRQQPLSHWSGCARLGVWYPVFGGSSAYLPGPAGFWPMYDESSTTDCTLVIESQITKHAPVAYSSRSATEKISLFSNRNPVLWKASDMVIRSIRQADTGGEEFVKSLPAYTPPVRGETLPGNLQMLSFGGRVLRRRITRRNGDLTAEAQRKWCIALRKKSANLNFDSPESYILFSCANDRFYADPFLISRDGRTFVFFEDFRYAEGRARISYSEILPDSSTTTPQDVLAPAFHLSYPFLWEEGNEVYMIPESRSKNNVVLYRATNFPNTWVPEAVLLDNVNVVDATIHKAGGKYWIFAGTSDGRFSTSDELSIFFSNSLKGPWTPHPRNPVVADVSRARPAGKLFYHDGRLIRPSQDCSKAYGYALVFSEVTKLSETEYEERPISHLYPESVPGNTANHTYNRTEAFEVIDRFMSVKVL